MDEKRVSLREYIKVKQHEMKFWEKQYRDKLLELLKKQGISFSLESIPEIIDATSFKAMMDNPNATPCPYYKDKKPCHDRIKDFNCFLCSCPGYDAEFVSEEGHSLLVGKCRLNSRKGIYFQHPHFSEVKIWDCSNCSAFHHPKSVEKYLRGHMQE